MLGRVLNNHESVFTFPELHFFEQIVSEQDFLYERNPSEGELLRVCSKLQQTLLTGYLKAQEPGPDDVDKASAFIKANDVKTYKQLYCDVLAEAADDGTEVIVEQTPRYIFSLEALLHLDESKIIHMIRDPRSVLASQKLKWRRRFRGGSNIPLKESLRAYLSYDPILVCSIWKRTVQLGEAWEANNRFLVIKFEDLIKYPEREISKVCEHIDISYSNELLKVPVVGSSRTTDSTVSGINRDVLDKNFSELNFLEKKFCEAFCSKELVTMGYKTERTSLVQQIIFLPLFALLFLKSAVSLALIFLLNRHRYKNPLSSAIKRLFR